MAMQIDQITGILKKRVISYVSLTTVKRQVEVLGNSKTWTYGLVQYKKDFN